MRGRRALWIGQGRFGKNQATQKDKENSKGKIMEQGKTFSFNYLAATAAKPPAPSIVTAGPENQSRRHTTTTGNNG